MGLTFAILCLVTRPFLSLLDWVMAKFYRSTRFPLLSASRFVQFDASVICHVFTHCFGSFVLQAMFFSLLVFAFKGQYMKLTI